MTGSDKSGVEFCDADLFVDRAVIVTPTEQTPPASIDAVTMFWQSLEARVISMSPADHDRTVAGTSHLPHVLSSVLAATTPAAFLPLVAGGWLDMTRVAAADALLWTQILQENKANVAAALTQFRAQLQRFETDLVNEDHDSITRQLAAGKQRRDAVGN
jgi:prephenate dehydrogenase